MWGVTYLADRQQCWGQLRPCLCTRDLLGARLIKSLIVINKPGARREWDNRNHSNDWRRKIFPSGGSKKFNFFFHPKPCLFWEVASPPRRGMHLKRPKWKMFLQLVGKMLNAIIFRLLLQLSSYGFQKCISCPGERQSDQNRNFSHRDRSIGRYVHIGRWATSIEIVVKVR